MLPLGGMLIALFTAWALPKSILADQLELQCSAGITIWRVLGGVIAPIGVLIVFVYTIWPVLQEVAAYVRGLM